MLELKLDQEFVINYYNINSRTKKYVSCDFEPSIVDSGNVEPKLHLELFKGKFKRAISKITFHDEDECFEISENALVSTKVEFCELSSIAYNGRLFDTYTFAGNKKERPYSVFTISELSKTLNLEIGKKYIIVVE